MWCRAKGRCGFGKGWWCSSPSGSRPNFCGRQHLAFDKGDKGVVRSKGILSFYNDCGNGKVRCNGRSEQGKDALACAPKVLSMDA